MKRFARPSGLIRMGKALFRPPKLVEMRVGAPARILFIADVHLRKDHPEMAERVVSSCTKAAPDLILLGGDLAEYGEGLDVFLRALRGAFPLAPVCAVPGNNDDGILDGDRKAQAGVYAKYGAEYLCNEARRFTFCGRGVTVAGVEDAYTHTPSAEGLFFPEGSSEEDEDKNDYRILLSHAPHRFLLDAGADLMLCGHTHGGQINVLGLTCYLLPYEARFDYALLSGCCRFGRTLLLVSRGVGYSKYPVRVGADSEIHLIV